MSKMQRRAHPILGRGPVAPRWTVVLNSDLVSKRPLDPRGSAEWESYSSRRMGATRSEGSGELVTMGKRGSGCQVDEIDFRVAPGGYEEQNKLLARPQNPKNFTQKFHSKLPDLSMMSYL